MYVSGQSNKLTLQNLHQELKKLKQPFLKKVKESASDFHAKVQQSKNIQTIQTQNQEEIPIPPRCSESQEDSKEQKTQNQMKKYIASSEKARQNKGRVYEWNHDDEEHFQNFQDLSKTYVDMFTKKINTKHSKKKEIVEDFRKDQQQLILQIFEEIGDGNTAKFEAIEEFFESYDLFYYFYNIHPDRLLNILKDSARAHEDGLTRQQFLDLFLIDRPSIVSFGKKTEKKLGGESVLNENIWEEMKIIFDTLDTFGNNQVKIRSFFIKVKALPSYNQMIKSEAIFFPETKRIYTLQKVLFDIENKIKFEEKIDWETLKDLIENFHHIPEPTIDVVFENQIKKGNIKKDTNYFMIDKEVRKIIKNIFHRCPKYSNYFVKTKFFSYQMLESSHLKQFLNCPSKLQNSTKKTYLTVETIIKELSKSAPQFLDLDEILEYFSIKGANKNKVFGIDFEEMQSTSSSEQNENQRQQRKLKKIKSLQNLKKMKKNNRKTWRVNEVTKFKEFNLYKKQVETIRQKKVKKMINEKKEEDEKELKKKFKANQIPVSLNSQKYLKYQKQMEKKKQLIKNQLALEYEAHNNVVDYLKSNTKLFQQKKSKPHCKWYNNEQYVYEIKPLPINTMEQLLPKIEQQKLERREKIHEQTKKKYQQYYWKTLEQPIHKNQDSLLQHLQNIEEGKKFEQIKANEVPNFEELHRKFQEQLQRRRNKFKPTKVKEFKLTSPKPSKIHENEEQFYRSPFKMSKSPTSISSPKYEIKSTKKYEDWVHFNQQKSAQREMQRIQKQKLQEQRLIKQRNFAKYMRKSLANCVSNQNSLRQKTKEKLKKFKYYMKDLEGQTEKQLAQMYGRVLQRPFLFQESQQFQINENENESNKKSNPTKVKDKTVKGQKDKNYEYIPGIFEKEEDDFHPIQSENLNQSF